MKYKIEDVIHKNCKYCDKDFTTFNNTQIYCSTECAKNRNIEKFMKPHKESSEDIYRRDDYRCVYCGKSSIEDGVKLVVDHVYPVVKGGDAELFNLVTSCVRCNLEKRDLVLPSELIKRIWNRNEKLNEKMDLIAYEKLKKHFQKDLAKRRKNYTFKEFKEDAKRVFDSPETR
jgi:hypothetical protein